MLRVPTYFLLVRKELGTYTLTDAEFPLQAGVKPIDRSPCRSNPKQRQSRLIVTWQDIKVSIFYWDPQQCGGGMEPLQTGHS